MSPTISEGVDLTEVTTSLMEIRLHAQAISEHTDQPGQVPRQDNDEVATGRWLIARIVCLANYIHRRFHRLYGGARDGLLRLSTRFRMMEGISHQRPRRLQRCRAAWAHNDRIIPPYPPQGS